MIVTPGAKIPRVDGLIILGRGISPEGELSYGSRRNAEIGAQVVRAVRPRVVVASTWRSWPQVAAGIVPARTEGGAMLEHLIHTLENEYDGVPDTVELRAEEQSTSTLENFVNSTPMLNMRPGERLGIVSDTLHFMFRRPQYLSHKTNPGIKAVPLKVPRLEQPSPSRIIEELASTIAALALFSQIDNGDLEGLMIQQQKIQEWNTQYRAA